MFFVKLANPKIGQRAMSFYQSGILTYLRKRRADSSAERRLPTDRHLLVASVVAISTGFGVVAAFGSISDGSNPIIVQRDVVESLLLYDAKLIDSDRSPYVYEEKIRPGDTAAALLGRLGIEDTKLISAARNHPEGQPLFRQLTPGKAIRAYVNRNGDLQGLLFPLSGSTDQALELHISGDGFDISKQPLVLEKRVVYKSAEISHSLFGATDSVDIPDAIATQLVDIFGGDIDFHRDLRKGDHFSVAYETVSHLGKSQRGGRVLAAEFVNGGRRLTALWFEGVEGKGGFYTPDGKSLRKAFLRSPLEFSRVTSGFSTARFHPILQKWRAHKGVDYGAPVGTQVKATGDAIVDYVGVQGGYGKVIVLKHQGPYTTLYGHLSGFARGLHKGSHVSQGDLIGYVGQTGLASGPHLHYEFRIVGVFKNPLSVALPGALPLSAEQLSRFRSDASPWLARIDGMRNVNLASAD